MTETTTEPTPAPGQDTRAARRARTQADTAVSRIVGSNTIRLRRARLLSREDLLRTIHANGHGLRRHSLLCIEAGVNDKGGLRAVTVDELCWLAEALGVAPGRLLSTGPCPTCDDTPPNGFVCKDCGAEADRE